MKVKYHLPTKPKDYLAFTARVGTKIVRGEILNTGSGWRWSLDRSPHFSDSHYNTKIQAIQAACNSKRK